MRCAATSTVGTAALVDGNKTDLIAAADSALCVAKCGGRTAP
jgi:hypothetical protein